MRTSLLLARFAALGLISAPADAAWFGNKQKDVDRLLVFPTIAYPSRSTPGEYQVDLHAIAIDTGSPDGPAGRSIFKMMCGGKDTYFDERWAPFPATYSAGAPMSVTIGKDQKTEIKDIGPVAQSGHVEKTVSLSSPRNDLPIQMDVSVEGFNKKTLTKSMKVHMAQPEGWGVISDIDDTVKTSQILSIPKLLKRAFCQEYVPEKGMPELYSYLKKSLTKSIEPTRALSDPVFYYLSGSPWQLLAPMTKFIENYFPLGEIIMDELNLRCIKSLIHSVDVIDYKKGHIRDIFSKFPKRKWLLIGDAGEHDPEIYADIYDEFPANVCRIFIRLVDGTDKAKEDKQNADTRFEETFKKVPAGKWDTLTPLKIDEFLSKTPLDFSDCV